MDIITNRKSKILDIVKGVASKMSARYFVNNYPSLYSEINNHCKVNNREVLFKEKIWLWVNNEIDFPKCICGNYTKINPNWINGFKRNCSVACMSKDKIRIENQKKSVEEKYGSRSYFKTDDYKEKTLKNNLVKYGVDHYSKTEEYKEKVKNTNIAKYGVDHYSKTNDFKTRIEETSITKYGVSNYGSTDESKEKSRNTNLSKYGVDNYTKTKEYLEKTKDTNLVKYGKEFYLQSDDYKEKTKTTYLDRYGVDHYSKTEEYKEKVKNSNLVKYGVDHYSKTDECKEKIKNMNIIKYGFSSHTMNEKHRKDNYKIANSPFYISYLGDTNNLFKCDCGFDHNFEMMTTSYYHRYDNNLPLCLICHPLNKTASFKELEFIDYIKSIYSGEIIQSYRDNLEIDIYLPELKIGFEFNGLYFHSEKFRDKNYHLNKTNYFKEKGIHIIHIWEDDWFFKKNILKSQINNILDISEGKIFARKCIVKEIIDIKIIREFLDNNHIQGYVNSVIKLGLYYNDELISLTTFDHNEGRKKMIDSEWNLSRFCTKLDTNLVGGASKLLKYFVRNYKPQRIISYADKDWSQGKLYDSLGFNKISESKPDYKYIINKKRINKSKFRKSNLNTDLSEYSYMKKENIHRIFDCGKIKFEFISK